MPSASKKVSARFLEIASSHPEAATRKMFGQPAAFVNGQMCFGVFGDELFLRLGENDRLKAESIPGAHLFEPMPGRPMREYVVFPPKLWEDRPAFEDWVKRSISYANALPPKEAKRAAPNSPRPRGRR
jgi:TfoX/Sxy family transcriptional regulator of competence genes